ncbi:MAG: ethylbenzene dehydrogenase-related protein [Thermoanaerobaculia bacterium]|nr:ethylbenzene dehydrogenase-related protein [Thermoanaerobaculia bacterium]
MKNLKTRTVIMALVLFLGGRMVLDFMACTHDDQLLDIYTPTGPAVSDKELIAEKTTAAPAIDGVVEAAWDNLPKLVTRTVVPDPGDNVFRGYVGDAYTVTMRSMYDNENVYFLIEWDDPTNSLERNTWYFDPATKKWAQESGAPTYNAQGVKTRDAFYEDKLAILWNINNTVANWNSTTCYSSCHTGLGQANGYARHYTNSATERIDMWHWKLVRDGVWGIMDDQYQDNTQPNGRKSDPKVSGSYTDNKQTLTIASTGASVSVPKYFIPGRDFYYWITKAEIDAGTAKLITAVDENGVLTYDGGALDPTGNPDFQRAGAGVGPKGIPSIYTEKVTGNRGDVNGFGFYNGSGWVFEIKRKLNTGDTENVDVNFADLSDQYFGIGVFENAQIAHAIKANLLLKFKR